MVIPCKFFGDFDCPLQFEVHFLFCFWGPQPDIRAKPVVLNSLLAPHLFELGKGKLQPIVGGLLSDDRAES
jgi:hypothetical protein